MAEIPSIRYGTELVTRSDATTRIATRLLDRLPQALWDTDPTSETVQRDLYRAFATQMALWLENRTIARQMLLLLEAQGLDLDALLRDYGLRRYLQRPDAYARQVGMHLLYIPQGTEHALGILADLLFDLPHRVVRTGRNEAHIFVADTHPITTPYTYWGLISDEGLWYAVTIHKGLPAISQIPPPGLNVAPGPRTLHWFQVLDDTQLPWYISIQGNTLTTSETIPAWGTGTTEPFRVLDGDLGLWELRIRRATSSLVSVPVTGSEPYAYWRVRSVEGDTYAVYVDTQVPTISLTPPAGRDETPTTTDLDWFTVWDETDTPWSVSIQGQTLQLSRILPTTGTGTAVPFRVLDGQGNWWELQANRQRHALQTSLLSPVYMTATVLNPGHAFQAVQLHDADAVPWWISISHRRLQVSSVLPTGATDVTPAGGPYRWLRVYGPTGQRWYGFPQPSGVWIVSDTTPGGLGTALPQYLGDDEGIQWHFGVGHATFGLSNTPSRDFEGLATALVINDAQGKRWFWRITGILSRFEVSNVLWPDTISQMPWGEIGWLKMTMTSGAVRYVYPEIHTGQPTVNSAPPMTSWWGWTEALTLQDNQGVIWDLSIADSGVLAYAPQGVEDIPHRPPLLSLRDVTEAYEHIQTAGSLVTILIS